MARSREVGEALPALRPQHVGVDRPDRALRALAADREDLPVREGRSGAAARLRDRSQPRPPPRPRVVDLEAVRVRVDPGAAAADRVHPRAGRGRREVLARRRAGQARPAARLQVEREGDPGEPAPAVDAAEDVELAAGDRGCCCGTRVGQLRQAPPGLVLAEHEHGLEGVAIAAVAADDVDVAVRARGRGMVDRERQVREPSPRVPGDRVGVGAGRVATVRGEAADDDDLAAGDTCGDLRPRLRQRRVRLPRRRSRRPRAAPSGAARWGAIVAESLERTSFALQKPSLASTA